MNLFSVVCKDKLRINQLYIFSETLYGSVYAGGSVYSDELQKQLGFVVL